VISDAHEGLKAAVAKVLRVAWQRCRVGLLKILYAGRPARPLGGIEATAGKAAVRRKCPNPARTDMAQ
jgi:hypothetical protein